MGGNRKSFGRQKIKIKLWEDESKPRIAQRRFVDVLISKFAFGPPIFMGWWEFWSRSMLLAESSH